MKSESHNLSALDAARRDLINQQPDKRRRDYVRDRFDQYLIGALSTDVPNDVWDQAMEYAAEACGQIAARLYPEEV